MHLYHGSGTKVGQEDISDKDIVLTTYETLYADMNGSKTLSKVSWFRIVLDEGKHNILQAVIPTKLLCRYSPSYTESLNEMLSGRYESQGSTAMVSDWNTSSKRVG